MVKKVFVPAYLFISNKRDLWYIVFYQVHPISGIRKEFRRSFDLNRIKNLKERKRQADRIVKKLNREWLPAGYPYEELFNQQIEKITISEAIEHALNVKRELPTKKSVQTYESKARGLISFLKEKN